MLCVVVGLKMAAKSASNSFLFTNEDGSPMVFVITPGDTKTRLRPIVENGGGVLTSQETPGAIRLVERDYKSGKRLVSSDFVFDSYKNGALCSIEEYRLETKPDVYVSSPKNHITVTTEKAAQNGRIKYSFEEDQAILNYLRKFEGQDIKLSGNKIWQEMEDKKVTCHRWQSMRSHYLSFLRHNSCASSKKGKLEFVDNKSISRSQISNNAKTFENISTCKKNRPTSLHLFQKDVRVNEERKDKENVCASLLKKQQHTTSFKNNFTCDKNVQQTHEKSSCKKNSVNMLDESESQDVEGKDMHGTESQDIEAEVLHDTSCSSSIVDMSSTTCCNKRLQPDDAEFCATCRKQNVPGSSCIEGSKKSCNSGIRKYFKVESKDNASDKVESGNVVPKHMLCIHDSQGITDECVPVLRCKQLFENFKQIQMISQKSPCGRQTPTSAQILHALYVSCGCLKCAFHYMQTGLLLNGKEIWKKEEDIAISSGDAVAINEIVNKRGQKTVDNRRQFISSIYC